MKSSSPALTVTLRALHGKTDLHGIAPAPGDPQFACVLALALDVDPVIRTHGVRTGE
jgi:hypothetical protein